MEEGGKRERRVKLDSSFSCFPRPGQSLPGEQMGIAHFHPLYIRCWARP